MKCIIHRNGFIIAESVEVASGLAKRLFGLIFRSSMKPRSALLVRGCKQIHTFLMRFPIDAVFIDSSGVVVGVEENLKPYHISGYYKTAADVLELHTGAVRTSGLEIGDTLQIQD